MLCLTLMLHACVNDVKEVDKIANGNLDATKDIGEEINLVYSDSGRILVRVVSPILERYNGVYGKDVFPKGIKITFLDDNENEKAWLEADNAEKEPNKSLMIARGNVKLYNTRLDKLESSELRWDENTKKIYTEKFVKITRPADRDTIYGIGFETDQNFSTIIIKKRIQSKLSGERVQGLSN